MDAEERSCTSCSKSRALGKWQDFDMNTVHESGGWSPKQHERDYHVSKPGMERAAGQGRTLA